MNSRDLDEILSDVAKTGESRSDWVFLFNFYFREGGQAELDAWARKHHLSLRAVNYDRGPNDRGQTLVFTRGPGWEPPATHPQKTQ